MGVGEVISIGFVVVTIFLVVLEWRRRSAPARSAPPSASKTQPRRPAR